MNWQRVSIGSVSNVVTKGTTPTSIGFNFAKEGIPFLRVNNIQNGKLISDDILFIDAKTDKALARSRIKSGDVLISIAGTIGRTAVVPPGTPAMNCNQAVAIVRLREDIDPYYVNHWLSTDDAVRQITGSKVTATISNLSLGCIKELQIPLPPLPEQRRIATILDKADAVRRKRQEAIALTEELLRSAFLEMFGDPVTNPKGWERCELHQLCSVIVDCPHTTPTYSSSVTEYPCIRTSDLQQGYIDLSTTKYVEQSQYQSRIQRHIPNPGDVLYSREGERFGIAARVPDGMSPCLGQRMMLFQANSSKALPAFLWALLNSSAIYRQAVQLVGGSTSPHVNVKDIKKFKVFCPPLEEQYRFQKLTERVDNLRQHNLIDFVESGTLFSSLLQRAFRGEL
jgi:type I restriction enzyme S subunit